MGKIACIDISRTLGSILLVLMCGCKFAANEASSPNPVPATPTPTPSPISEPSATPTPCPDCVTFEPHRTYAKDAANGFLLATSADASHWVGGGTDYNLTTVQGNFLGSATTNHNRVDLTLNVFSSTSWSLSFRAPNGQALKPGVYLDARDYPFGTSTKPNLSISSPGRGCNKNAGRFIIHEVSFGAGTTLDKFVAEFVQVCAETPTPKMGGIIRFNSATASSGWSYSTQEAYPPALPTAGYSIEFQSQAGDYIGQGQTFGLNTTEGVFTSSRVSNGVQIVFTGDDIWTLSFVAPNAAVLAAGTFNSATRYPFQAAGVPGLSVSGAGRGCNTLTGSFVVHETTYDGGGNILAFHADFEQHCEGGGPALLGTVRYNAPSGGLP